MRGDEKRENYMRTMQYHSHFDSHFDCLVSLDIQVEPVRVSRPVCVSSCSCYTNALTISSF